MTVLLNDNSEKLLRRKEKLPMLKIPNKFICL